MPGVPRLSCRGDAELVGLRAQNGALLQLRHSFETSFITLCVLISETDMDLGFQARLPHWVLLGRALTGPEPTVVPSGRHSDRQSRPARALGLKPIEQNPA